MSDVDILSIRKRLGRKNWGVPQGFGGGWQMDHLTSRSRIIITCSDLPMIPGSEGEWLHASISHAKFMPTYEELSMLHKAVWPDGYAYQVFAPPGQHVNIATYALHLWGRPDGSALLPEFGAMGTI